MIEKKIQSIKHLASKLQTTGFVSIFVSSILVKCVGLIGSILITRFMGKNDYGIYSYVINAYGMLNILADFGTAMACIQFGSEDYEKPEKQNAWFSYSFRKGMIFSVLSGMIIFFSPYFFSYKFEGASEITRFLCILPILENTSRFLLINAQIHLKNRIYAKINVFASLVRYVILLPMAYIWSVQGAILSEYLIQLLINIFAIRKTRSFLCFNGNTELLSCIEKRDFFRISAVNGINNILSNSLVLLDIFLLGILTANEDVLAAYKVASMLPTALMFIPSAVQVYLMPILASKIKFKSDANRIYRNAVYLLSLFNFPLVGVSVLFGPSIMIALYGKAYVDASTCFYILMIGYFFSSIRYVAYTTLCTRRKVGMIFGVSFSANVLNIIFDVLLIPSYGSIGAACASTLVNIMMALFMIVYLRVYFIKEVC